MPFIFFCRSPAVTATRLSTSLKKTAMLLGADKYITHKNFDEQRFLSEVNDFLKTTPSCTEDRK
jgi:hypothetical protein